jgi:hypothetical protein
MRNTITFRKRDKVLFDGTYISTGVWAVPANTAKINFKFSYHRECLKYILTGQPFRVLDGHLETKCPYDIKAVLEKSKKNRDNVVLHDTNISYIHSSGHLCSVLYNQHTEHVISLDYAKFSMIKGDLNEEIVGSTENAPVLVGDYALIMPIKYDTNNKALWLITKALREHK